MKPFVSLFLCAALVFLSGCWDRRELNQISLVTGMGVDQGEERKYRFSVEALNATALDPKKGGNESASIVFSQEGEDVAELASKMNVGLSRQLEYSHMRLLVVGEGVAQQGMMEFFDYLERSRQIRNDFNVVVVRGAQAADVLKITYPIQKVSTMKLSSQLKTMVKEWGGDPDVRLSDLINALVSPGREPVAVIIGIQGPVEKGQGNGNMQSTSPDAMVLIEGMAVFKDLKMLGALAIEDTRNFLWLQNKLKKTSVTASCLEGSRLTADIYNSDTDIQAAYESGRPVFTIDVVFESRLETAQCRMDVSKPDVIPEFEKLIAKTVEDQLLATIRKVQDQYGVDIFGFGEDMQRQAYQQFKKVKDNWNEEFARAEFKVNVTAKIRRTGLNTKSFLDVMNEKGK